jgi:hypothetical protein
LNLLILYTANIRGDLDRLPRLHTFIRQLKAQPVEEEAEVMLCAVEPVPARTLLLDLGGSCDPAVWHCAATGGRSSLIVLDAMGYDAAHVVLSPESRARLSANLLRLALVDADHPWTNGDLLLSAGGNPARQVDCRLRILLAPADATQLNGDSLHLVDVEAGQVGLAQVQMDAPIRLIAQAVFDLPAFMPADPTISATVDFVLSEARYFQRKNI